MRDIFALNTVYTSVPLPFLCLQLLFVVVNVHACSNTLSFAIAHPICTIGYKSGTLRSLNYTGTLPNYLRCFRKHTGFPTILKVLLLDVTLILWFKHRNNFTAWTREAGPSSCSLKAVARSIECIQPAECVAFCIGLSSSCVTLEGVYIDDRLQRCLKADRKIPWFSVSVGRVFP